MSAVPSIAPDDVVVRRALNVYESRRADALAAREALDLTVPLVAAMHRRDPDDVRRLLVAALPACERALLFPPVRAAAPVATVLPPLDPVATVRETLRVALDALHLAADVAEGERDEGAHTRALRAMAHLLRAGRAFDGVAR